MEKAKNVLREIEFQAGKLFLPIVGPVKGQVLADEVSRKKPKRVLEIGTLVGYSAILMASRLGQEGKIVSVEINPDLAKIARRNIEKAGFSDKVEVVVADALEVTPSLSGPFSARGGPALGWDFVFIDAAKEEYFNYLKSIENKLASGAVIVADNAKVFAEGMADYLDYVRNSERYKSRFVDCGQDGVEVSTFRR